QHVGRGVRAGPGAEHAALDVIEFERNGWCLGHGTSSRLLAKQPTLVLGSSWGGRDARARRSGEQAAPPCHVENEKLESRWRRGGCEWRGSGRWRCCRRWAAAPRRRERTKGAVGTTSRAMRASCSGCCRPSVVSTSPTTSGSTPAPAGAINRWKSAESCG